MVQEAGVSSKSEKFVPDDDMQTMLALGITKPAPAIETETVSYTRQKNTINEKKQGHGRGVMPTHLPFIDQVIEPQEVTDGMVRIGEEVSWHYEMKPGSLFIKRIIRPKYALPQGDGVVIGELPALPIDKGNAGPGLMTQVVIDKYVTTCLLIVSVKSTKMNIMLIFRNRHCAIS